MRNLKQQSEEKYLEKIKLQLVVGTRIMRNAAHPNYQTEGIGPSP